MIEFTKSYKTADGQVFGSIEAAQVHEVEATLTKLITNLGPNAVKSFPAADVARMIVAEADTIVDILTTTPNSKPKARKINGGSKARKKTVITDAATPITTGANVPDGTDS